MNGSLQRIGPAARASGLSVPAVRFYESSGLLTPAPRSEGGYRLYSPDDVRRLKLIRRARALGLALPAVRDLVQAAFEEPCRDFEPRLKVALDERVADLDRQLAELAELRLQLAELQHHLTGACRCEHPAGECSGCSLAGDEPLNSGGCACNCCGPANMSNARSG